MVPSYIKVLYTGMYRHAAAELEWVEIFFSFQMYDWILDFPIHCSILMGADFEDMIYVSGMILARK